MRRAAKVDATQAAIVKALRKVGAFVQPLHQVGAGCPDLLVGYRQRWFLIECKSGKKWKLTQDQRIWFTEAQRRAPVYVATTPLEAIDILRLA